MKTPADLIAAAWQKLGARPYDALYRRGAPWEGAPRAELVTLLSSGRLSPSVTPGPRALDVGCGSGADSLLLAEHGFDVTGVDFSSVAIAKARHAAGRRPNVRFVEADLFNLPTSVTEQPYDLIFDGGTLDDFPPKSRQRLASILTGLARPGTVVVMWCFSAAPEEAPWFSVKGPSRIGGLGIVPAEVASLFGGTWQIESMPTSDPEALAACYLMTRA